MALVSPSPTKDASSIGDSNRNTIFSDPGDDKWAGWDKKTPDLPNLLKHVRKGNLLAQFRAAQDALPLCDACGRAAKNFTEFKVT